MSHLLALLLSALEPATALSLPDGPSLVVARRPSAAVTVIIQFRTGLEANREVLDLANASRVALLEANRALEPRALSEALFSADGNLSSYVSWNRTTYELTCAPAELDAVLGVVLPGLFKPKLDDARLAALLTHPLPWPFAGDDNDALGPFLVQHTPLERPPAAATVDLIKRHLGLTFTPANADVVVAGPVDVEALKRHLAPFTGGRRLETPRPLLVPSSSGTFLGLTDEHLVMMSFDRSKAQAMATLRVAVEALTQAILEPLRKQGNTYFIAVEPYVSTWTNLLTIVVPVGDSQRYDAKQMESASIEALKQGKLSNVDFEAARSRALAVWATRALDSVQTARCYAGAEGDERWCGPEAEVALHELTLEGFNRELSRFLGGAFGYRLRVTRGFLR
ncbi:MAG: hypothetical protein SFW67_32160 [Myxococcaceae bacterium]|nr:hypothetical protein [Myxococcaceae bacterium]